MGRNGDLVTSVNEINEGYDLVLGGKRREIEKGQTHSRLFAVVLYRMYYVCTKDIKIDEHIHLDPNS